MNALYLFATFMSKKKYRVKKKKLCEFQLKYYEPVFFYPNCVRFDSSVESLVGLKGMKFIVTSIKKRESYDTHIWIEDPHKVGAVRLEEKYEGLSKPWEVLESEKYFAKEKVHETLLNPEGLDFLSLYIKQDAWGFEARAGSQEISKEYRSKKLPKDHTPDRLWKDPATLQKYLVYLRNKFIDQKIPEKACVRFDELKAPQIVIGSSFSQVVGNHHVEHADKWLRWRLKSSNAGFIKKTFESFISTFAIHTKNKLFYYSSSYCANQGTTKRLFWVNFEEGKSYQVADKLQGSINVAEHESLLTIVADELEISKVFFLDSRKLENLSRGQSIELATLVDEIAPLFPDLKIETFDLQTSFIRAICTGDLLFTFFCSSHSGSLLFKARLPAGYLAYSLPTAERLEFVKVGAIRRSLVLASMMTTGRLLVLAVDCRKLKKARVFAAQDNRFDQMHVDRHRIYLVERANHFDYSITRIAFYF